MQLEDLTRPMPSVREEQRSEFLGEATVKSPEAQEVVPGRTRAQARVRLPSSRPLLGRLPRSICLANFER
jgi:hypothetical protein